VIKNLLVNLTIFNVYIRVKTKHCKSVTKTSSYVNQLTALTLTTRHIHPVL